VKPRTYRLYLIGFGTPEGELTEEHKCRLRAIMKECDNCTFFPAGIEVGQGVVAVVDGMFRLLVCVGLEHDGKVAVMAIQDEGATA